MDSIPPSPPQITLNDGSNKTNSSSVKLRIVAENHISSVFISGDIMDDSNTFEWVPYKSDLIVNLSGLDGKKTLNVKLRDEAGNESAEASATIELNRESPYETDLVISTTQEGAKSGKSDKYSSSKEIFLGISALNAIEMNISGDVEVSPNTFGWIKYGPLLKVNLSENDGIKSVIIKFRNQKMIESEPIAKSIILDTSPPANIAIKIQDSNDPSDNDNIYHSGQSIKFTAECTESNPSKAEILISSKALGYSSGRLPMVTITTEGIWQTEYLWNTASLNLKESDDYLVEVYFMDLAGWSAKNTPIYITVDNTPPKDASILINDGAKRTASRNISLKSSAKDAVEMFVNGDVLEDANTYRWIPVKSPVNLTLTIDNGVKNIYVKFIDKAGNETNLVNAIIIYSDSVPEIDKISSWDSSDTSDNDGVYNAGELITLGIKAQEYAESPLIETNLLAKISIKSSDGKYNLAIKNAREESGGWYTYVWDTKSLTEGDYSVNWTLSDGVGQETNDNSFKVTIDNTPPKNSQIIINNGEKFTNSRSVNLDLKSESASWVLIDGDVINEKGLTFGWIPFKVPSQKISVRLNEGDGQKQVNAKFKDDANNVADVVYSLITLDTIGPDAVSVKINDGAEYTSFTKIDLKILATNAIRMYIDGDLADSDLVRSWIDFGSNISDLNLSDGDGTKTVTVAFEDSISNRSNEISDEIILDTTPPEIISVSSSNSEDPTDSDGRYKEGTKILIKTDIGETDTISTIQIASLSTGYDSGIQTMESLNNSYIWDTRFLKPASDYIAKIVVKDKANNSSINESLIIAIYDSSAKIQITINDNKKITKSRTVDAKFLADNASEVYIDGDIVDDNNTFEWVKFSESKKINLTSSDGIKNINVQFRDSSQHIIGTANASITLDQTPPSIVGVETLSDSYKAGDKAIIIISAGKGETNLKGTIQIRSPLTEYDSGIQKAIGSLDGTYSYSWNTDGLKEDNNYIVEATLSDEAGWTVIDRSLILSIDNTPPQNCDFVMNDNEPYSHKRSINLHFAFPDDAVEMFIDGDLVDDSNTYKWTGTQENLVVNLLLLDGKKTVRTMFRDKAGNATKTIEKSIILNESPPTIISVDSSDVNNPPDNDNVYHAGQMVKVRIVVEDKEIVTSNVEDSKLIGQIRISSEQNGYDSEFLIASRVDLASFEMIWDTTGLSAADDYIVQAVVEDEYGQIATDDSVHIQIDNTPPNVPKLLIDGGKNITISQNVILKTESDSAGEMYIDGDVIESQLTFSWIPYAEIINIRLTDGGGKKNITVRLRDSGGNISESATTSITLDKSIPSNISVSISNGAEYTESHSVTLSLSADNAREMYISGDLVNDDNTFKWVTFQRNIEVRLSNSEGEKNVFAKFRNGIDNESDETSDQILLDFTPPGIANLDTYDELDKNDNDLFYHSGQRIVIGAMASNNESNLKGLVNIKSIDSSENYDSGMQVMVGVGNFYSYIWDTSDIAEGKYKCQVQLEDKANHQISDLVEIYIDNVGPTNPSIEINLENDMAFSRTIEAELKADGEPTEVFIEGDIIDDNNTFEWIEFHSNDPENINKMKISLNLRGTDGEKRISAKFRNKYNSESSQSEKKIFLELKRPELVGSCRIVQVNTEPIQAYLSLRFDEPINKIDPKNFFLTLKDNNDPQKTLQLDGTINEISSSNDVVIVEILEEQINELKQWEPFSTLSSYIKAEITENCIFDKADKGNLSNEKNPIDVFFIAPELSVQLNLDTSSFSPNGDNIKDKMFITYSLSQNSDVSIKIVNSQKETIKEWYSEDQVAGTAYQLEWDGKNNGNTTYPDGSYFIILMGAGIGANSSAFGMKQNFSIDNSVPKILEIRPGDGSNIPGLLRASARIIDLPETGGIESVYMTIDDDVESQFPLAKSKSEGEYTIPSSSELVLSPGSHNITFHVLDMAGNKAEKNVNYTIVTAVKPSLYLINFPNPFICGNSTNIRYSLPENATNGNIAIYDSSGEMVFFKKLTADELNIGEYTFPWDGRDILGNIMARGIYFCKLNINTESGGKSKIHKVAIR